MFRLYVPAEVDLRNQQLSINYMCIQVNREGRHTSVPHTLFLISIPSLCLFTLRKSSLIIVIFSITYHKRFLLVHHAMCV